MTERLPRRAILLPACAAIIGALVGTLGLLHRAPEMTAVPPGYIALINNKGLLISDFEALTAASTGKAFENTSVAERRKVLRDMIDEELLVQRGTNLDLPETTTEVRDAMKEAVNAQITAALKGQPPTEAELKSYYQAHIAAYSTTGSMSLRDLVLHVGGYQDIDQSTAQAETDAAEAIYQLRAGAPIDRVAEHFGMTDSGRADNGEVLDFAANLHLGRKLFDAARGLKDGEVSNPIADSDGVHVLVMQHRNAPRSADFNSVRAKVYTDYLEAQSKRAQEESLKVYRGEAHIILAPGAPS
jgi:parvulin-like peptidyl-prolyl isomerase